MLAGRGLFRRHKKWDNDTSVSGRQGTPPRLVSQYCIVRAEENRGDMGGMEGESDKGRDREREIALWHLV